MKCKLSPSILGSAIGSAILGSVLVAVPVSLRAQESARGPAKQTNALTKQDDTKQKDRTGKQVQITGDLVDLERFFLRGESTEQRFLGDEGGTSKGKPDEGTAGEGKEGAVAGRVAYGESRDEVSPGSMIGLNTPDRLILLIFENDVRRRYQEHVAKNDAPSRSEAADFVRSHTSVRVDGRLIEKKGMVAIVVDRVRKADEDKADKSKADGRQ